MDPPALERYQALPPTPLRQFIQEHLIHDSPAVSPDPVSPVPRVPPGAAIALLPSGDCPLLSPDRLCRIQVELGPEALCTICSQYPRKPASIDKLEEKSLDLSCPEAARMVLLPSALSICGNSGPVLDWEESAPPDTPLRRFFWAIRDFTVRLILNRTYPIWKRLFLLGIFARRLESLTASPTRSFGAVLDDFDAALRDPRLLQNMDRIQPDLPAQLALVLNLAAQHVERYQIKPSRLKHLLESFAAGICDSGSASPEEQIQRYRRAHNELFVPFFHKHPYMLENYLLNETFTTFFPFGPNIFSPTAPPAFSATYAHLVTQFAFIQTLLIGIAAFRGEDFCPQDVIDCVQSTVRHFQHSRLFLEDSIKVLADRGMDNPHGLAILIRH